VLPPSGICAAFFSARDQRFALRLSGKPLIKALKHVIDSVFELTDTTPLLLQRLKHKCEDIHTLDEGLHGGHCLVLQSCLWRSFSISLNTILLLTSMAMIG